MNKKQRWGNRMLLKELKPGTVVQIEAHNRKMTKEFETVIVDVLDNDLVLIEPVRFNNMLINFQAAGIATDLLYKTNDDLTIKFPNVNPDKTRDARGNLYQCMDGNIEGDMVNRRESARFLINREVVWTTGAHTKAADVIARDVSQTGISIVSNNTEVEIGQAVRVAWNEKDIGGIIVEAEVVRKVEIRDNSEILYGCKFTKSSPLISKLVMKIQREELKRMSGMS